MSCAAVRLPAAPRCSSAAPRSRTRCAAAQPAAAPPSRRAALAAALAVLASAAAPRAHAYGGSGNIRSTDEGSGNPRYEDLVASLKARGGIVSKIDTDGGKPPAKGKCSTGKELACQ